VASDEGQAPSEEDLVAALEEQFKRLKVVDLLAQTVVTVSQLGFMRMAADGRDLEQAKLAIEALRALVPVLKGALPEGAVRDFESVVANMQLAYARAAAEETGTAGQEAPAR
jgi:hypothetical protein